eukprot:7855680-Pyramimonas_sp.AAC.1
MTQVCTWDPETRSPYKSASRSNSFSGRILSVPSLDRVLSPQTPPSPPPQTPPRTPDTYARFCQMQNSPRSPPRTPGTPGSVFSRCTSASFRAARSNPELLSNYDYQRNGLWTPQSRRVGPMAGPDPYNVKRDSAFGFTPKRSQQWATPS